MTELEVKEIRNILISELEKYQGEPILLPLDAHILQQIIFDTVLPSKCKKISDDLKYVLKKIDFFNIPFDNVLLRLCNFNELKGVRINPQTVYCKDLSKCKFKGVTFIGSFDNVICADSNFNGSTGAVINPQKLAFKNLRNTKLGGIKFTGTFDGVVIQNADFTGSTNAIINLRMVEGSNLTGTNLCDTLVIGSTDGLTLNYTSFKGAKNKKGEMIKINPKTIEQRKMIGCNFDGVYFTHNFNGCEIDFSSFLGSVGAVITPQKLKDKSLVGTTLTNVTFDGNFDNVRIENANFTGSTGAVINPQMIYDKSLIGTTLDSVTFDGIFNNCKIKGANFTGSVNAVINPQTIYCKNLTNVNLTDAIVVDDFKGLLLTTNMIMCQEENLIDKDENYIEEESEKEYVIRMIKSLFK